MLEIWKEIPGFPRYQVSSLGRVKSNTTHGKGSLMVPTLKGKYYQILLYNEEGKRVRHQVSRLVLLAFVGPCPEGMEGCHGNGNPTDNWLTNLYWGTKEKNWEDRRKHGNGMDGAKNVKAVLTLSQVEEIRSRVFVRGCGTSWAKEFGVSPSTILRVVSGKNWQ